MRVELNGIEPLIIQPNRASFSMHLCFPKLICLLRINPKKCLRPITCHLVQNVCLSIEYGWGYPQVSSLGNNTWGMLSVILSMRRHDNLVGYGDCID